MQIYKKKNSHELLHPNSWFQNYRLEIYDDRAMYHANYTDSPIF